MFSTHPPESVWGTVNSYSTQPAAFLGSVASMTSALRARRHPLALFPRFFPGGTTYRFVPGYPSPGSPSLLRPCSAPNCWYRNINLFPIGFAIRLHLRGRLTLPGLSLDRKPWVFGEEVFHLLYRYSRQHSHFLPLHQYLTIWLHCSRNAPLPLANANLRLRRRA